MKYLAILAVFTTGSLFGQDSIKYRITYRDTVIYKYDTVNVTYKVKHYLHTDTTIVDNVKRKKHSINTNNWGIGPSFGTYYSPINGFDLNIGFGIQYYFSAIPGFSKARNPHMGRRNRRK